MIFNLYCVDIWSYTILFFVFDVVKEHADHNASKTILGRSSESMKVLLSKVVSKKQVLEKLKEQFLNNVQILLFNRKISLKLNLSAKACKVRRNLYNILSKDKYFTKENIHFVITTKEQGCSYFNDIKFIS